MVVGGAALLALGLVSRTTRDVDVVALMKDGGAAVGRPAAARSPGSGADRGERLQPAAELAERRAGLPRQPRAAGGPAQRAAGRDYGQALHVLFAARIDQIHFKLYATADQGAGRHLNDLQALAASEHPAAQVTCWTMTDDPSEAHRDILLEVLAHMGVNDAAEQL